MQSRVKGIMLFTALLLVASARSQSLSDCTPIDKAGFLITLPGVYCVTRDLDTRFDFADHSAENPVIDIRVGNVTVDLQGHRVGRGRFLVQRDGTGILMSTRQLEGEQGASPRIQNVTIRNGVLADFAQGVVYDASAYQRPSTSRQVSQSDDNTFIYAEANIVMKDLKFVRCGKDKAFQDWLTR